MDEDKKKQIKKLLADITRLIEEVLDEKEAVKEISAGALGSVGGHSGKSSFFDELPGKRDSKRRRYRTYTPENKKR
jgi:hypothetical protein